MRVTDGRTDDRILIARPRLHSMQRSKNGENLVSPNWHYTQFSLFWHLLGFSCCGQRHNLIVQYQYSQYSAAEAGKAHVVLLMSRTANE